MITIAAINKSADVYEIITIESDGYHLLYVDGGYVIEERGFFPMEDYGRGDLRLFADMLGKFIPETRILREPIVIEDLNMASLEAAFVEAERRK